VILAPVAPEGFEPLSEVAIRCVIVGVTGCPAVCPAGWSVLELGGGALPALAVLQAIAPRYRGIAEVEGPTRLGI
jgi:hypothetical protein